MKHAILCLASYGREALVAWLQQFPTNYNIDIYIHMDGQCVEDGVMLEELQAINPHVKFAKHALVCKRFSSNMSAAMMLLASVAVKHHYDYYHYMSESCWMLKPWKVFNQVFANANGKSFIDFQKSNKMTAWSTWFVFQNKRIDKSFYKASQWFSMSSYIAERLTSQQSFNLFGKYVKKRSDGDIRLIRVAFDECIIQTIIIRNILDDDPQMINKYVIKDNLRYINWEQTHSSPRVLKLSESKDPEFKYDMNYIDNYALIGRKIDYKDPDSLNFILDVVSRKNKELQQWS